MNQVQTKFKELLQSFSGVQGEKLRDETINHIISISKDEELQKFIEFISKDMSENGRMHIETEGIMILLAEKNPNANAEELVKKYYSLWR